MDITGTVRADRLRGTNGDDRIDGLDGGDVINGRAANDYIIGGGDDDRLYGSEGIDVLDGGTGNDVMKGGSVAQEGGGGGMDRLMGGEGNDRLIGGVGSDVLIGGTGDDRFTFQSVSDSTFNDSDSIADFEQGADKLVFRREFADDNLHFIGRDSFSGVPGEVRFESGSGQSQVLIDIEGDGVADIGIVFLNAEIQFQRSDFSF